MALTFEYPFTVLRVLDGDTVEGAADLGFSIARKVTVRLAGVNAPETSGAEKEVGILVRACVGKWFVSGAEVPHSRVWLTSKEVDKYGRVLGVISIRSHVNQVSPPLTLNEWLLTMKLVKPYDGGARAPYTTKELAVIAAIATEYRK